MIRVKLPYQLRKLANVGAEISIEIEGAVTIGSILNELETRYPMLKGTIRDHYTMKRRAFLRFFACEEDYSYGSMDDSLPDEVAKGKEPFLIVGAIAGG